MRGFKEGIFDKERVPKQFQRWSPVEALGGLEDVDLEGLWESGKRLILLDVDNTLLPWRSEDVPQHTVDWLARARGLGFDLCILSNTRNPERLGRLSEKLGVEFIRDKFKPNPKMYYLALGKFGVKDDEAVMIGDQLLTDIWGANRAGIDALWVKPMGGKEFVGTKYFSRNIERVIGKILHNYFQADGVDAAVKPGFFRHETVRQLVKFGLVGGVATAVDFGIHYFLMFKAGGSDGALKAEVGKWVISTFGLDWPLDYGHLQDAAYAPLKVPAVMVAIMISYLLNRLYTFRTTHEKVTMKQVFQFYTVALVGMVIAVSVGAVGQRLADASPMMEWAAGSLLGMVAGFFWNFTGQKLWTFRKK